MSGVPPDPPPAPTSAPWISFRPSITAAILLIYWLLHALRPRPGPRPSRPRLPPPGPRPQPRRLARTEPSTPPASSFLHTGKLYETTRDPEGLLSTLPSVATTLLGVLAALWLRRAPTGPHLPRWLTTRNGLLARRPPHSSHLARLWNSWFPINKNLWTSSYVLYAAGWSLLLLALFYWLFDSARIQHRSRTSPAPSSGPLLVFGSNAITAFALSNLAVELLLWWKLPRPDAPPITAWHWLYFHLFAPRGSTNNTSLAFAVAFVALCFLPNWFLWRRKLFLRV